MKQIVGLQEIAENEGFWKLIALKKRLSVNWVFCEIYVEQFSGMLIMNLKDCRLYNKWFWK